MGGRCNRQGSLHARLVSGGHKTSCFLQSPSKSKGYRGLSHAAGPEAHYHMTESRPCPCAASGSESQAHAPSSEEGVGASSCLSHPGPTHLLFSWPSPTGPWGHRGGEVPDTRINAAFKARFCHSLEQVNHHLCPALSGIIEITPTCKDMRITGNNV